MEEPSDDTTTTIQNKLSSSSSSSSASSSSSSSCMNDMMMLSLSDAAESKWIARQSAGRNYSSTSTVYAEHSIKNPDQHQVLFCLATVLQAQIFEDFPRAKALSYLNPCALPSPLLRSASYPVYDPLKIREHPEFDVNPHLPAEYGGWLDIIPMDIVNKEAPEDYALQEQLIAGSVPLLDSLYRFMCYLQDRAQYPVECNIISLVYLNRVTSAMGHCLPLTFANWRMVWASAVILAQKVWDDKPLRTSSFATILPGITKTQLRDMEFHMLDILQFNTGVPPSQYARYYFELRVLFEEVIGKHRVDEWRTKPLSMRSAQRLEDRCNRTLSYQQRDHPYHQRQQLYQSTSQSTTSSHQQAPQPLQAPHQQAQQQHPVSAEVCSIWRNVSSPPGTQAIPSGIAADSAAGVIGIRPPMKSEKSTNGPTNSVCLVNIKSSDSANCVVADLVQGKIAEIDANNHSDIAISTVFSTCSNNLSITQPNNLNAIPSSTSSHHSNSVRSSSGSLTGTAVHLLNVVVNYGATPRETSRTLEDVTCSDTSRFVIS